MKEPMPPTPEERAEERLSWLSAEVIDKLGPQAALDMCFAEDISMAWDERPDGTWVVKRIKGVTPAGKSFLLINGGAKAIVGMTEKEFDSLPGRDELCTEYEYPESD